MAFRCKYAESPACLLCGEADGGHHALSGCKAMERPVTEIHNGAARILIRSIAQGRHGAGLVQADIGSRDKVTAAGLPFKSTKVPSDLFPKSWPPAKVQAAQKRFKPDAVLKVKGKEGK